MGLHFGGFGINRGVLFAREPDVASLNRLFAFKGVGGVGIRRSGGGSVGGSFGG